MMSSLLTFLPLDVQTAARLHELSRAFFCFDFYAPVRLFMQARDWLEFALGYICLAEQLEDSPDCVSLSCLVAKSQVPTSPIPYA